MFNGDKVNYYASKYAFKF